MKEVGYKSKHKFSIDDESSTQGFTKLNFELRPYVESLLLSLTIQVYNYARYPGMARICHVYEMLTMLIMHNIISKKILQLL